MPLYHRPVMACRFPRMGRRIRPHLCGATFHVTTRVHRREALFTPALRSALVSIVWEQVDRSDVELFAYVIMPNHLHLVLRQGKAPLHRFVQPILRRAALLVQRSHRREGHVFERRYRDRPCGDPDYIRNAIIYTHLNPVRAGLCSEPGEYSWSSHALWANQALSAATSPHPIALSRATQLFASAPDQTPRELSLNYLAFLTWRQAYDRAQAAEADNAQMVTLPPRPIVGSGDESWVVHQPSQRDVSEGPVRAPPATPNSITTRADLRTIASAASRAIGPGLDLDLVRSRWGGSPYVRARHEIILRASTAGYRGVEIAAFLRITPNAVYDVIGAARKRLRHPYCDPALSPAR